MSQPFVYVGVVKIKPGKVEEFKKLWPEHVQLCETNEPRLIAFHAFLDEEAGKAAIVQVHPDSESMKFHMQVIAEHVGGMSDWLEGTESENVYGQPYEGMIESWKEWFPGATYNVFTKHEGGFTRTNAAP